MNLFLWVIKSDNIVSESFFWYTVVCPDPPRETPFC